NSDVESIYQRYLQAFKKGVYNYIKEEPDTLTNQLISRKYFSGGFTATHLSNFAMTINTELPKDFDKAMNVQKMVLVMANFKRVPQMEKNKAMVVSRREFLKQAVAITAGLLTLPVSVQAKESEQKVLLRSKLSALKSETDLDKRDAIIHEIQWIILGWKRNKDIKPLILDFVSMMSDDDWRRNGGVLESLYNVAPAFSGLENGFFTMISSRRQEIEAGVISPIAIWKVYRNLEFIKVAKRRNESNQFSLARAVTYEIERYSQPLSDKNIEGMVGFIDKISRQYENYRFLDKNTKVILVTDGIEDHAEGLLKIQHFLKDVIGISDSQIKLVKAPQGTELQDAIVASRGSKTFLWTYSHGSAHTVVIGGQGSISSDVFAKALQQRGNLDELTVLARSCFSGDSWTRVINQLKNERSLPLVLASILGTTSYEDGINMLEAALDSNKKAVTIGRMRVAEDIMTHRIKKGKEGGIAVSDSTDPVGFLRLSSDQLMEEWRILGLDSQNLPSPVKRPFKDSKVYEYELLGPDVRALLSDQAMSASYDKNSPFVGPKANELNKLNNGSWNGKIYPSLINGLEWALKDVPSLKGAGVLNPGKRKVLREPTFNEILSRLVLFEGLKADLSKGYPYRIEFPKRGQSIARFV
ncbi:MAG: hypothetical protein WCH62_08865, partial [Candidatus Omnitrophota bacterium]